MSSLAWKVGLPGLVLFGAMLLIGSYTFLPSIVEGMFGRAIQDNLRLKAVPGVNLSSEPQPSILAGRFDSGRVVLEGADFEGIRPDRVVIDLSPFDLSVLRSISNGSFESEEPLSGTFRIYLSGREVARLANAGSRGPTVEAVRLEQERMTVEFEPTVMGVNVPVSVVGELNLEGRTLRFEPRRIAAFGMPLPERLSDRLVSQAGFEYALENLPYGIEVSDVRVEEGRVVVEGGTIRIPLGSTGG